MTTLLQERTRWILWIPVALGLGISFYFSLTFEPAWHLILAGLFLSFFIFFWLKRYPIGQFIGLMLCCLSIGFTAAKIRTAHVDTRMLNSKVTTTFKGIIIDVEKFPDKARLIIAPLNQPILPQRVRLNIKTPPQLTPGDTVVVTADLLPLSNPVSPYGYNFRRAAYFQGIGAVGRLKTLEILEKSDFILIRWRYELTEKLRQIIPGEAGTIAAALITGDRTGIISAIRQAYADAGIAHILAISGLHLSIVAALGFLTIRRGLCLVPYLTERYPIKKWAALGAIFLTAFYLSISGFAVPAKRAFVMTSLVMVGILVDRRALSMRSLAFAAIGILLLWPDVLLSASFQLSFAAVTALIAAYEWKGAILYQWTFDQPWWRKIILYISGIVFSTLIATAATTPFTIAIFNRFTVQAILGNLLAIPLTALWIMPCAVLTVLSFSWGGSTFIFQVFKLGLDLLTAIAQKIAILPGAAILIPTPPPLFLIFIVLGGLWLCLWQKSWRLWGIIPICLGLGILFITRPPDILIAEDRSTIAIRTDKVLRVSPGRQSAFHQELWMRELGLKEKSAWPESIYALKNIILIDQSTHQLPYSKLKYYCQEYAVVISNGYLPKFCKAAQTIDRTSLKIQGSQLFWINGHQKLTLQQSLGNRPWVNHKKKLTSSR